MRDWQIFATAKDGSVQGQITDYSQFDGIIRRRDVGSWSIKMRSGDQADALSEPGAGIFFVLDEPNEPTLEILTGAAIQSEPKWSEDTDEVVISGLTDAEILWNYIVYPTSPDWTREDGKAFADDAYDLLQGVCESVMKHYVEFNCQDLYRIVPGVPALDVGPDLGRGGVVTGRGRFQYLGDLLQQLAVAGGDLGFDIIKNVFDVSVPRDLTKEQVFSIESGNLNGYSAKRTRPTATAALVAGGEEGVDRVFSLQRDIEAEALWGRRIEKFVDRRDTVDLGELRQTGQETLLDGAEIRVVDLQVIDVANRRFGKDWNVGDYVTTEDFPSVVRQAQITLDENGETVTPTIDSVTTVTAQSLIGLFDSIRALRRRVNLLERTQ